MKTHRNGTESIEIPFDSGASSSYDCDLKSPVASSTSLSNDFESKSQTKHVSYQQWVDPIDVFLSNWNPVDAREIISKQPKVLAEKLNIENLNLKSLTDFGQSKPNGNEEELKENESLFETDPQHIMTVEDNVNCNLVPDTTTQKDYEEIHEILSDSDDDCETIRHQLNNHAWRQMKQETNSVRPNYRNESVGNAITYISSDDEEDITESYHCYFCNWRFRTLGELGEHEKYCNSKCEDGF